MINLRIQRSLIGNPRHLSQCGETCAYCTERSSQNVKVLGKYVIPACSLDVTVANRDRRAWLYSQGAVDLADITVSGALDPISVPWHGTMVSGTALGLAEKGDDGQWVIYVLLREAHVRLRLRLKYLKHSGWTPEQITEFQLALDAAYKTEHDDYLVRAAQPIISTVFKGGREVMALQAPAGRFKNVAEIKVESVRY